MKKFKIAHLYYDLMNLYGENGNIRYLVKCLEEQGIEVEVHFLSMEEKIDFKKYPSDNVFCPVLVKNDFERY